MLLAWPQRTNIPTLYGKMTKRYPLKTPFILLVGQPFSDGGSTVVGVKWEDWRHKCNMHALGKLTICSMQIEFLFIYTYSELQVSKYSTITVLYKLTMHIVLQYIVRHKTYYTSSYLYYCTVQDTRRPNPISLPTNWGVCQPNGRHRPIARHPLVLYIAVYTCTYACFTCHGWWVVSRDINTNLFRIFVTVCTNQLYSQERILTSPWYLVLAVYMPPHAPGPGHECCVISLHSSSLLRS